MNESQNINLEVKINNKIIFEMTDKIDHEKLIYTVNTIENVLLENSVKQSKIRSINELTIEILQNIINYAHTCTKKEYTSNFKIYYSTNNDEYILESTNIIAKSKKETILERANNVINLDKDELRKLLREKMRSKKDLHEFGAGLGFIVMARKASKNIEVSFEKYEADEDLLKFNLKLHV